MFSIRLVARDDVRVGDRIGYSWIGDLVGLCHRRAHSTEGLGAVLLVPLVRIGGARRFVSDVLVIRPPKALEQQRIVES